MQVYWRNDDYQAQLTAMSATAGRQLMKIQFAEVRIILMTAFQDPADQLHQNMITIKHRHVCGFSYRNK